jgi:hypothetical protein
MPFAEEADIADGGGDHAGRAIYCVLQGLPLKPASDGRCSHHQIKLLELSRGTNLLR